MTIGKKLSLVQTVVELIKAEKRPIEHERWTRREAIDKFRKTLPDEPGAEFRAYLDGNNPLGFPDDFDPSEFGLDENSTVEQYQEVYYRMIEETPSQSLMSAFWLRG